jgi:hypothetical protein
MKMTEQHIKGALEAIQKIQDAIPANIALPVKRRMSIDHYRENKTINETRQEIRDAVERVREFYDEEVKQQLTSSMGKLI